MDSLNHHLRITFENHIIELHLVSLYGRENTKVPNYPYNIETTKMISNTPDPICCSPLIMEPCINIKFSFHLLSGNQVV